MKAQYTRARARTTGGRAAATRPELAFRAHLTLAQRAGAVTWFKMEPCSFRLADNTYYRPDALHVEADTGFSVYTEVKQGDRVTGLPLTTEDSWVKLKTVAEMFPIYVFRRATWSRQSGQFTVEDIPGGTL